MLRNEIKNLIKDAVKEEWGDLAANTAKIEIEIPEKAAFGDYSSNIAMKMAKSAIFKNPQNPLSIAEKIKDSILINLKSPIFKKTCPVRNIISNGVETVKPGFLNFYLSPEYLQEKLFQIASEAENFGKINIGKNEAPPTGVGSISLKTRRGAKSSPRTSCRNLDSQNSLGSKYLKKSTTGTGQAEDHWHQRLSAPPRRGGLLVRDKFIQIEFISANPTGPLTLGNARGGFLGDILANILEFADFRVEREYFINNARTSNQIQELGKTFLGQSESYLTPKLKLLIKKISQNKKNKIVNDAGEMGHLLASKIQTENRQFIEKKLKIKFDNWFPEELLFENKIIKKTLSFLEYNNFVYRKDGALWLKTSLLGDDEDRVIVRADGEPTYFLSDIAYHFNKFGRGYDKIIDIWGADHHGHTKRLKTALKMLSINPSRLEIIITQFVRIIAKGEKKKMSKRAGQYITLEELIKEVGLDATRFFFAMRSADTHLDFDIELAKEKSEKNPLYYIQYASARMHGILAKRKTQSARLRQCFDGQTKCKTTNLKLLIHSKELELIKQLLRFPEIIEDISRDYQIHRLPNYLLELTTSFHQFYENCRVICDNKTLADARLSLIKATQIVLENGLKLMGISAPSRM